MKHPAIRRVIVAQDVASRDLETLSAAVELAARLKAEVVGVFLEDLNLFRLLQLPVARQVNPWGQPLSPERLEAELQALSRRVEKELGAAAKRSGVRWSFQVMRGEPEQELAALGLDDDLWVIGMTPQMLGLQARLPSRLGNVVQQLARPTLLLPGPTAFAHPLAVVSAVDSVEGVLAVASELAASERALSVLMVNGEDLERHTRSWLNHQSIKANLMHIGQATIEKLVGLRSLTGSDVLVVDAGLSLLKGSGAEQLVAATKRPVLVVGDRRQRTADREGREE